MRLKAGEDMSRVAMKEGEGVGVPACLPSVWVIRGRKSETDKNETDSLSISQVT